MGFEVIEATQPIKIGDTWAGTFYFESQPPYTIPVESNRGGYDASGDTFPAAGGSGTAGAILAGDLFEITAPGTVGGTAVAIGDEILALVNTPGATAANWQVINKTAIDVTTDDWILTFKEGDEVIIVLSTDNGGLVVDNTNEIAYSIGSADSAQFTPRKIYGELRNESSKQTLFGINATITSSANE